jgi:hypothetical protein
MQALLALVRRCAREPIRTKEHSKQANNNTKLAQKSSPSPPPSAPPTPTPPSAAPTPSPPPAAALTPCPPPAAAPTPCSTPATTLPPAQPQSEVVAWSRPARVGEHHDSHSREVMAEFRALYDKIGAAAIHETSGNVKERTLRTWKREYEKGTPLPPAGHSRRAGGGKPRAFSAAQLAPAVNAAKERKQVAGFVSQRYLQDSLSQHCGKPDPKTHPQWAGGTPEYFAQRYGETGFYPANKVNKAKPSQRKGDKVYTKQDLEDVRASVLAHLTETYAWRVDYCKRHGVPLAMEPIYTLGRLINFDEVSLPYHDEDKGAFTVMLCTTGDGDLLLIMVIFNNMCPAPSTVVDVEGVLFFVAYNDTHWNNKVLHHEYLASLISTLVPCPCADPMCTSHLVSYDRFGGHFSSDIVKIFTEKRCAGHLVYCLYSARP